MISATNVPKQYGETKWKPGPNETETGTAEMWLSFYSIFHCLKRLISILCAESFSFSIQTIHALSLKKKRIVRSKF
jgi:hypothetical protein